MLVGSCRRTSSGLSWCKCRDMTHWNIASPAGSCPPPGKRCLCFSRAALPWTLRQSWSLFLACGKLVEPFLPFFSLTVVYRNSSLLYMRIMPEVWRTSVLNRERFFLLQKLEQLAKICWMSWSSPSKKWLKSDRSACTGAPGLASSRPGPWSGCGRPQPRLMRTPSLPGSSWAVSLPVHSSVWTFTLSGAGSRTCVSLRGRWERFRFWKYNILYFGDSFKSPWKHF